MPQVVGATQLAGGGTVSSVSWSHTVTSTDPNRALVIRVHFGDGGAAISSVTVDGNAATFVGVANAGAAYNTAMYVYSAPSAGVRAIVVTLAASAEVWGSSTEIEDVDTTDPVRSGSIQSNFGTIGTSPIEVTVPSAVGDLVMDGASANSTAFGAGAGQTEILNNLASDWQGASHEAGAASVVMSWSKASGPLIGISIIAASFQPPAGGGTATTLGVPFAAAAGSDLAPSIEEGVPPAALAVPYLGEIGAEYAPTIAVAPAPLAVPFLGAAGAEFAPSVAVAPVQLGVPLATAAGADHSPAIQEGVPSAVVATPFLPEGGTEWVPGIEEGVPAGVLAVPFAAELGEEYAPAVVAARSVDVPFLPAAGVEPAPVVEVAVVAVQVPFSAADGGAHAPTIIPGSLIILVPFSAATGGAWAPSIGGELRILPDHYFVFDGAPTRAFVLQGAPTRQFTFRR